MIQQINPIQKHKSEIEKRISELELKFRDRQLEKEPKRIRQNGENRVYGQQVSGLSKTVDIRTKQRQGPQRGRARREDSNIPVPRISHSPLKEMATTNNVSQIKQEKDEQIKELYEMMRSILVGQRNIEKEISELKKQKMNESTLKDKPSDISSHIQDRSNPFLQGSEEKTQFSQQNNHDSHAKPHHQNINQNAFGESKPKNRERTASRASSKLKTIKNKNKHFRDLVEQLKQENHDNKRFCIQEEIKHRIWAEVESRVRESDKQYKDTIHRNNKHEFDHLMNTYELQRKLKDELIDKVFQQCNPQIYK